MTEGSLVFIASQLAVQAPVLVVYLVTVIVALVYLRRVPLASALALVGTLILMAVSLAFPVITWLMISQRGPHYAAAMGFINFAASCVRATALSLLVCAIFVGRGRPAGDSAGR